MVVTLQHIALETRPQETEAAIAFWELLGFERVEPPSALRDRAAWVQRGATQVHLLFTDAPVVPPEGHTAVVAEDFGAAMQRLVAAGYEPEPRTQHWGAPRAFVRAPGGHLVEVMGAAPVIRAAEPPIGESSGR
jgi:catechol 2,3-dioxygenase-like lactoylglutathione lyase family enzyme